MGQFEHIQAQGLRLRQTYGTGIGRDLLHGQRLSLALPGGGTLVIEHFETSSQQNIPEALIGEKLSLELSDRVRVEHNANFYYTFRGPDRFRFEINSALTTRVFSRLSLVTSLTDRYLSNPLPGLLRNEILVSTGLSLRF